MSNGSDDAESVIDKKESNTDIFADLDQMIEIRNESGTIYKKSISSKMIEIANEREGS